MSSRVRLQRQKVPKPTDGTTTAPNPATGAQRPTPEKIRDEVQQLSRFAAKAIKSKEPGPYELVPGRYPDAVGLPQVLSQLGTTPQGQAAVTHLLDVLHERTGICVPPEVQAALLSNPSGATAALELSPRELSNGVLALNGAYQTGKVKAVAPRPELVPQGFDLANIAGLALPRPPTAVRDVAPGLARGSLPSALSDAQVKQNQVMADVLHRLSRDLSAPAEGRFEVQYQGQTYSRLDDFIAALRANGHDVNVSFEQRAANFADLKTPVPNSDPPRWLDVPGPLILRTGIRDAAGKEAVLPAAHSEMVITIASRLDTQGPKLDAQVKYYQGIDGTGFFPAGLSAEPRWLGRVTHATLDADQAVKAIALAGALSDVIGAVAKRDHLYAEGYGATGVCNDSVGIVEQAVLGRVDQFPLLMRDDLLYGELGRRLNDDDLRDHPLFGALRDAIEAVPSDMTMNDSLKARAFKSIPWAAGEEPFVSTVDARRILSQ